MAESRPNFTKELEDVLNAWRAKLDRAEIPELKDSIRVYHAAFRGLMELLVRNAVVSEDPYAHEHKISDIEPPSNDPIPDSERDHLISTRLSFYDAMLDFLTNYYQLSLDMLSLKDIKRIADTVGFFKWSQVNSGNSSHSSTRVLSEFVAKLRAGLNSMQSGIVSENINQLVKSQTRSVLSLKQLSAYKREEYKLTLRMEITDELFSSDIQPDQIDRALVDVKKAFKASAISGAFFADLAREVLAEDYTETGRTQRKNRLEELRPEQSNNAPSPKRQAQEREALLEAVRALAAVGGRLAECARKLKETSETYQSVRGGFFAALRKWFIGKIQGGRTQLVYEVEYVDITTSARSREPVDFVRFLEKLEKKGRQLNALLSKTSKATARIQAAPEDQVLSFLSNSIEEIQLMHRTLSALDEFFKGHMDGPEKSKVRGIKLELSSIREQIIKTNQLRHEYVARKEESEQLQKLGVTDA